MRPKGAGQLKCYEIYTCTYNEMQFACFPTGLPSNPNFMNVLTTGCEFCPVPGGD